MKNTCINACLHLIPIFLNKKKKQKIKKEKRKENEGAWGSEERKV